jgi:tRNA threonylcarbamoyladenosine biosynthesis protein TsaE
MAESHSIKETQNLAKDFLNTIKKGETAVVVGLRGNLGSGKTTFTKAVAEHLGLKQTVTSPTFVIEKIYQLCPMSDMGQERSFKYLIHIDAYRLEKGDELLTLGWKETSKDPDNLIFIEWPENVLSVLPKDIRYIDFKFINETTREIT